MAAHHLRHAAVRGVKCAAGKLMARAFTAEFFLMRKRYGYGGRTIFLYEHNFPQVVFDDETRQWVVIGRSWKAGKMPERILEWISSRLIRQSHDMDESEADELVKYAFRQAYLNRHTTTCPLRSKTPKKKAAKKSASKKKAACMKSRQFATV